MHKIHILIDLSHIYYKYKFTYASGRLKSLSYPVEENGVVKDKDITLIYHVVSDIEKIRKTWQEKYGYDTIISICFDSKSARKEVDTEYKATRHGKLTEDDISNLAEIAEVLKVAGYNVYKENGYEADDLVYKLLHEVPDVAHFRAIYSSDKDLLVNIDERTSAAIYRTTQGYHSVSIGNFSASLEEMFGCKVPYNTLELLLSTVGDKSDNIKGISGFGKSAYNKLIDYLSDKVDFKTGDTESFMEISREYLGDKKYEEMVSSYQMVKPYIGEITLDIPESVVTQESRIAAYERYGFKSLMK